MFSVVVIDLCAIFAIIDAVFMFFGVLFAVRWKKSFRYKVLISKADI